MKSTNDNAGSLPRHCSANRLAMAEACLAEIRSMMPGKWEGMELTWCVRQLILGKPSRRDNAIAEAETLAPAGEAGQPGNSPEIPDGSNHSAAFNSSPNTQAQPRAGHL